MNKTISFRVNLIISSWQSLFMRKVQYWILSQWADKHKQKGLTSWERVPKQPSEVEPKPLTVSQDQHMPTFSIVSW